MNDPLIGQTLGGCLIRELIGKGAMGRVYRAEQISLQRPVAIKVLDINFARDQAFVERFFREARSAARLIHANVVQVYDVGVDRGVYYIITELIEGHNLGEIISTQGRLPASQALEITRQATLALTRAAEFAIIHRDIKPDNIMVNQHGEVKIADFGLAKRVSEDTNVTEHGMVLGTPYYMSPEQAKGLPLDHRTDIYSLGATMYHVLTGQVPFDAPTHMKILSRHVNDPVTPPDQIVHDIPRAVSDLIVKMMAKNPDDRYETPRELLLAIAQVKEVLKRGTSLDNPKPATAMMRPVSPSDKRRFPRISADFVAKLSGINLPENKAKSLRARILNISRGGIFITSEQPLPIDSLLEIRFRLPGKQEEIRAVGVVRWITGAPDAPGMGIQFVRIAEEDNQKVSSFLDSGEAEAAVKSLTRDGPHKRILSFYLKNLGNSMTIEEIMSRMGVGKGIVDEMIKELGTWGLSRVHEDLVTFLPPESPELERALNTYHLEQ